MAKGKPGKGPIPQLDETGVVSSTEMTGIAPAGLPHEPGEDFFNELYPDSSPMTGAHADDATKKTR